MTASTKDDNPLATQLMYFSKPFKVNVKTDGNGEIKVESTAFSFDEVKFTIEPKKGYVLGEVKVIDSNGNVLTFHENTFTMPSADVLIEATFVKETINPETLTGFTMVIVMLAGVCTAIIIISNYRKLRWLR